MQCFVDGHDIASDIVRFGMGRDYEAYSKGHYQFDETFAKKNKHGIWANSASEEEI